MFRNLRNMYGIADADYMLSLGGSSALWQLNSPGKSGCMFFLSDDERFLIKTMRKTEIKTLIEMLPKYYRCVRGMWVGSLVTSLITFPGDAAGMYQSKTRAVTL